MEKRIVNKIESYMTMDDFFEEEEFDDVKESSFAMVMDLTDIRPGELELEDEVKTGYLRNKYIKSNK